MSPAIIEVITAILANALATQAIGEVAKALAWTLPTTVALVAVAVLACSAVVASHWRGVNLLAVAFTAAIGVILGVAAL